MANSEHLAKIEEGVEVWNEWRAANPRTSLDLSGMKLGEAKFNKAGFSDVDLSNAMLLLADLRGANLSGARLVGADLRRANLTDAHLKGADLRRANLHNANLSAADLDEADLTGSNLILADIRSASLSKANLDQATVGGTVFGYNDLSDTRGLDTVRHAGPSAIDIDTIYCSQGKIPAAFLRGAGVPENLIEYIPSLAARGAIQFYSCFISYSTKDQGFADRLWADLQNKGVRCWFAPHNVQGGKKLHEQIDEAIRRYERLLLILSPNSMNSEWVKTEIRKARNREREEKKRVLFPVRLASLKAIRDWELFDADEGKDLAVEIREYYIPDFSNWKNHDSYAKALLDLVRDLVTSAPSAPQTGRGR
jgi:uncharacterized protein YjbI with pentapeptide repeats